MIFTLLATRRSLQSTEDGRMVRVEDVGEETESTSQALTLGSAQSTQGRL